ncbi:MAG TPA: kelch repeat-containing protein [Bryobacteraceae bacterium]|nr:kelch repeat-containing protein [Bryobacteraceae bacterium]
MSGLLSSQFGVPEVQAINQAGDLVFVGRGGSALFFRAAGSATPSRLLQVGDAIPGVTGSQVTTFAPGVGINLSAKIVFSVTYSLPDARPHQALMTYDGSTFQRIISSDDVAPAGDGTFGNVILPIPLGSINDKGDIAFSAAPTSTTLFTLYIVPAGGAAVRIVAARDFLPSSQTNLFLNVTPISGLNALGQLLVSGFTNSGPGLFIGDAVSAGKIAKVMLTGEPLCDGSGLPTVFGSVNSNAVLNNAGTYAFTEQSSANSVVCVGTASSGPAKAFGAGTAAPTDIGGTLGTQFTNAHLAIDASGDIIFASPISGSALTTAALLRFHSSDGHLDTIAYRGEAAPGVAGKFFVGAFSEYSSSSNGTVGFVDTLTGGSFGLYRQSGTTAPSLVALSGQATPLAGGGTFALASAPASKQLDNGYLFFTSQVSGGTAYYGQFLDTVGTLKPLMSTADALPSGSNVSLLYGLPQASGDYVGFGAQHAGGKISLLSSNTTSGTTLVNITDGDIFAGTGGVIVGPEVNYFVNGNGQIVFTSALLGGSASHAILLSSPGSGLSKVAAVGDATPIPGVTFLDFSLNSQPPSPINNAGQVAFSGTLSDVNVSSGVFLYSPAAGGTVAKIAAVGDSVATSTGTVTVTDFTGTASFDTLSLNQSGQVAFGASLSGGQIGFLSGTGASLSKIALTGDIGSTGSVTDLELLDGLNDSGLLTFTGATASFPNGWSVLTGTANGTPSVIASQFQAAPGGGFFNFGGGTQVGNVTFISTTFDALGDNQNDVAFRSFITQGPRNSGIFLMDGTGPLAGTLRAGILEGDPVPLSPTLTLGTLTTSTNFALGPDGQLATVVNYGLSSAATNQGMFFLRKNGTLARVLGAGDTVVDGGVLSGIRMNQNLAAGSPGKFVFWAQMDGGSVHQAILSTAGTHVTAVALSSSLNPAVIAQSVTITAVVSSTSTQTPTGTVTFFDNNVSIATVPLSISGNAALTTSFPSAGPHSITAQYSGDAAFSANTSGTLVQTILASGISPVITSASTTTFVVGLASSFTVTATGIPAITISQTGPLPNGVQFDASTGILSGTPTADTNGTYPLTITVQNGILPNAVQNFTLTVSAAPGGWAATSGSSAQRRSGHTATMLNNGLVLLAGGSSPNSADLFDPQTGTFTPTSSTAQTRFGHTATLLNDGRVLITGGSDGNSSVPLATAELYDPATGTFAATGAMSTPRGGNTATLLNSGKVLIAGGSNGFTGLATAELYDPATGLFSPTGNMISPRGSPSATLLNNGKVLIVGGSNDSSSYWATSEIYDPATGTFTASGTMATPRSGHLATLLNNNKVLILAGFNGTSGFLANPELYDVATGTFSSLNGLSVTVGVPSATLLTDGTVLIAGGFDGTNSQSTAFIYDPINSTFNATGSMAVSRESPTATLLNNGEVFVAGGDHVVNNGSLSVASAEVYRPSSFTPPGLVSITVTPANPVALRGATEKFVATGTFNDTTTQILGSAIWSSSNNSIATISDDVSNRGSAYVLAAAGSSTIRACADSICGSTILAVGPAPNIVSPPVTTFTVGVLGSFSVTAFGVPNPTLSETGALPSGVTLDSVTGVLSGKPDRGTGGIYPITLIAQNGVLPNATQSFTLTVNEAPWFTSAATGLFAESNFGTFTVTAFGYPPPTFTESGSLPSNVAFDATTHILSGTPAVGTGGSYNITFSAQNGVLPDATQSFTLTVNQPPSFISGPSAAFTIGSIGTFTVRASGVPTPVLSESGALPAGVLFDSATGILSGKPTSVTPGDYPITFTAQDGVPPAAVQNFVLSLTRWTATGSLGIAINLQTATLLNNGKVLVAGGADSSSLPVANAELYDPATGTFTPTGNMVIARYEHTATLLNNGKVLIAGGFDPYTTAELYDPETGTFSLTGDMPVNRFRHTATLLNDGRVLIAGGDSTLNLPTAFASAEVYDPATGTFTTVGNMTAQRTFHTATLLTNGKVLITGGRTAATYWASAELFDPSTSTFSATGSMSTVRTFQTATLLNDGTVLITGGGTLQLPGLASAELFNPITGTFSAAGSMSSARSFHSATLLSDGTVLVAGGENNLGVLSTAELYDPASKTFTATDTMLSTRAGSAAALLNSGDVLMTGGFDRTFSDIASAEIYPAGKSAPPGLVSIALTPADPVLAVGTSVRLTATGTFSDNSKQQLSSVVWSSSNSTAVPISNDSTNRGSIYAAAPTPSATIRACAAAICGSTAVVTGVAPGFNSANNATWTAGLFGSFTVTATGSPAPGLLESGSLPAGVGFDTTTGVLSGTPATGSSGTYILTLTAHNGIGNDAAQTFTLTVVPAPAIVSFTAGSSAISSGSSTTLTAMFSNGTGVVDNGVGAVTSGVPKTVAPISTTTYMLTVTNLAGTAVTASAQVTITNPIPAITSLSPAHASAGAAIPALTVNGANFVSGSVVKFNGKAETTTFVSASRLTAMIPATDNNQGGDVEITVSNPDPNAITSAGETFTADSFTPTALTSAETSQAGQPAQFTFMIAPSTANGFPNTVTFAASGLPPGAQATFNPNPAPAGASVTMTVTTTARGSFSPRFGMPIQPPGAFQALPIGFAVVALLILISFRRQRRWLSVVPMGALLLCLCLTSCGSSGGGSGSVGGPSGTPAGTYNMTVTATSGTLVQTIQVTLIVK